MRRSGAERSTFLDLARSDVFIDVCGQREYLDDNGVRRCRNAADIRPRIRRVMALARWSGTRVISCVDTRRPSDLDDYFPVARDVPIWRRKAAYTLLPRFTVVESDNFLSVPLDLLRRHQQAIFVNYHRDPFTNPKLDRMLTELPVGRFVVFGSPLETSVRILILGLVRRGRRVGLVHDACGYWSRDDAALVMRQIEVKGVELMTADQLIAHTFARMRPAPTRMRVRRSVA